MGGARRAQDRAGGLIERPTAPSGPVAPATDDGKATDDLVRRLGREVAQPSHEGGIAAVSSNPCPYPSGKLGIHMVDAETYTAILYGTTPTYTNIDDIIRHLQDAVAPYYDPRGACGRCIQTLEIWGHGDLGGGYLSFGANDLVVKNATLVADAERKFAAIRGVMCDGGNVVMNECRAGMGASGTAALQRLADAIGVPVSGPTGDIKGCRVIGGLLTGYKEQAPSRNARTPQQNRPGPVRR